MTARVWYLSRLKPGTTEATRVTGIVAVALVCPDGVSILHWLTEPRGTEIYPSEDAMRQIREASGRSVFTEGP